MRCVGALTAATLVLASAAGCGDEPALGTRFAELLPFSTHAVATDVMFPRAEGASRFLLRNWPPLQTLEGDVLWVHGTWARLQFFAVADEPPTFVAEARPFAPPGAPIQSLAVIVNGVETSTTVMFNGWRTYEFETPREAIHPGWNVIELRFAHSLRPRDFDPSSDDGRTLAAAFRRLEMRHASGRTPSPEGSQAVVTTGSVAAQPTSAAATAAPAAEASIDMPADSLLEVYAAPGRGAELVGAVEAEFAGPDTAAEIHVVVDIFDDEHTTRLWESTLRPSRPGAELRLDLTPWAERAVGMRLRVFGPSNGVVRWTGTGITAARTEVLSPPEKIVAPPRSGDLGRPDVFVIILDAARADMFAGELGSEIAPNVSALAGEGTRFSRAWAPSAWTGQTIPALWTGMVPDAIGSEHWGSRLPAQVTTFPELLYAAGYHTVLWSQHTIYSGRAGLRNGFEQFEYHAISSPASRAGLPAIADIIEEDRPTLAVIHLIAPHEPYIPPPPFRGSRSGWYDEEVPINATVLNQFDARIPVADTQLRDNIRRAAKAKYEENVLFADHLVGRLVEDLKRAGRYDDALIVVTSDHGEGFYEHGRFLHTQLVFEEFLRVPLVVKWPRSFSAFVPQVEAPVSLLDLAPTLIDGLGIEDERALYQGRTLLPLAAGGDNSARALYAYTSGTTNPERDPKPRRALLWNGFKLIYDGSSDRATLYRLAADPEEKVDIAADNATVTGLLLQTMRSLQTRSAGWLLQVGGAGVEDLDAETIRRLRALGYLR